MSTPLPLESVPEARTGAWRRAALGVVREPLFLFLVAGGTLFAIDHQLHPGDPQHHIVVTADVDEQARATFRAGRGRDPDAKELAVLRQVWIDNEVLYREGLAQQADKGDDMIRNRVIFKELLIVDAGVHLPAMDQPKLKAWFEAHRDKYDEPVRYTFQEGLPPASERNEAGIRAFVNMMNNNPPASIQADLRVFRGRPRSNLKDSYGEEFATTLDGMSAGSEWRAVQAKDGWHAIHLEEITPKVAADFATIQNVVMQDWKDETAAQMRTAEVRKMGSKYTVTVDAGKS
jgi:hypothetical protein